MFEGSLGDDIGAGVVGVAHGVGPPISHGGKPPHRVVGVTHRMAVVIGYAQAIAIGRISEERAGISIRDREARLRVKKCAMNGRDAIERVILISHLAESAIGGAPGYIV